MPANFIFEEISQRFNQFETKFVRQSSNIVMRLNRRGGTVGVGTTFDDVGIQRSLSQKVSVLNGDRFVAEAVDEQPPDNLSFLLRVGDSRKFRKESLSSINYVQVCFEVPSKMFFNLFAFAFSQQPVIHENARKLIANRF